MLGAEWRPADGVQIRRDIQQGARGKREEASDNGKGAIN
jgi:hypothetical protein